MKKVLAVVLALFALFLSTACKKSETAADLKPETATEQPEKKHNVNLAVSDEELGAYTDTIEDEYKSFEVVSMDTSDFFVGKKLRLAAVIQDHNMSNVYPLNATAEFTDSSLIINVPNAEGEIETNEFVLYTVADEVKNSPNGEDFSYAAYGTEEITSEETSGAISIVCRVEMREDIDMGDAAADSYVLVMETSTPDAYQIYKIEE